MFRYLFYKSALIYMSIVILLQYLNSIIFMIVSNSLITRTSEGTSVSKIRL